MSGWPRVQEEAIVSFLPGVAEVFNGALLCRYEAWHANAILSAGHCGIEIIAAGPGLLCS